MGKIKEFDIPVPWGHIAAKAWGDETDPWVLVFHGLLDNVGSFDRLIPLLPQEFYYICFDLPGHGRSSHLPLYLPFHTINYVMAYKLIVKHFGRDSYIFLAHSYGSLVCQYFARLYPQYVEKLIMIDIITLLPIPPQAAVDYVKYVFDFNMDLYKKSMSRGKPRYTYEEALQKVQNGRQHKFTVEEATPLLERALESVGDGKYTLATDQRVKCPFDPVHDIPYKKAHLYAHRVSCPMLLILATDTMVQVAKGNPALEVLQQWEKIKFRFVDGGHDIHIKSPEKVAAHITKFLRETNSKI